MGRRVGRRGSFVAGSKCFWTLGMRGTKTGHVWRYWDADGPVTRCNLYLSHSRCIPCYHLVVAVAAWCFLLLHATHRSHSWPIHGDFLLRRPFPPLKPSSRHQIKVMVLKPCCLSNATYVIIACRYFPLYTFRDWQQPHFNSH